VAAVVRQEPDLVCLQEVRPSTREPWAAALREAGLVHALDSGEFRNKRRLFNLTASRWPLTELPAIAAPHPERVLSTVVETPAGLLDLHNAHVPPAQSRGFTKVETCEAIYERLARPTDRHRVLCGDLNTPREETADGELITFAVNHPEWLERWDAAERSVIEGLAEWDLADAFRALNGWDRRDVSWVFHTRSRRKAGFRLDHVLASASLATSFCDYQHGWRELGLSDHSAIEAVFCPDADRRPDARGGTPS
jgi:exodeoxyribonuclease III